MKPRITLSIVSHGDSEKVAHLLASLQKYETTKQIQLILTDNLKNELSNFDSTVWASMQVIRNSQKLSFAENHNQAFQLAQGEYFSILNPDLIFESQIFDSLITTLNTHQAHIVAPLIVDENKNIQDSFRSLPTPYKIIKRRLLVQSFEAYYPKQNGILQPDWIAGMFWLMKSETYAQLKGMDEKFRLYFEDVDFCTRAKLQGMKILIDPQLQICHTAQRASKKRLYYLFLHILSATKFFTSSVYWQARRKYRNE